jgi:imidazoleglycerol-phosphate dehydratase
MFFYSGLKVSLVAEGDIDIDYHHLIEDTGIVIGQAIRGSFAGSKIQRFGNTVMPMDEALILVAMDISGRSGSYWDISFTTEKCGDFDLEVLEEFWKALAREAKLTIHFKMLSGRNSHHIAEAAFKGAGSALGQALQDSDRIKSTKGSLD